MPKTQVAFFEVSPEERRYLEKALEGNHDIAPAFHKSRLTPRTAINVQDASAIASFVYTKFDNELLSRLPNLRLIATMSTGFDHIDLDACAGRDITVSNVPVYGERTVAEHTFALLLALSRKIPESIDHVRRLDFRLEELQGFDLAGKTIGIIGLGHIGIHVARIARAFDMKVLISDPDAKQELLKELSARAVNLDTLLKNSDIITLHAPYNPRTHHLLNRENVRLIKPGAYIINTARGALIETEALLWGLDKKIIAGAGIDVLEEESFIKEERELLKRPQRNNQMLLTVMQDHVLINHPRVIVTPHNAFNSHEALCRILDTTIQNIERFLKGEPTNVVRYR